MCSKEIQIFRYTCTLLEVFLAFCVSNFYYIYSVEASDTAPNLPTPQTVTSKNAVGLVRSAWEIILSMDRF